MQRIQIEGIRKDPWFQKNYLPIKHKEEEVNLDDVCAVFDDIEVGCFQLCVIYSLVQHYSSTNS